MTINIYKPNRVSELLVLFPTLGIAKDYPVYNDIVVSDFEYDFKGSLFLLNSRSGVNVESVSGLCTFLRSIEYMQESKIQKLENLYKNKKVMPIVFYKEAIALKIANKSFSTDEESISLKQLLQGTLGDRISAVEKNGYDTSILQILNAIRVYYDKNEHLNPMTYKEYSELFKMFNFRDFRKDFSLTGNSQLDCYSLLTYFGG